jgi:death-on-curing protein
MTHDFPTTQEVTVIHEALIQEFGGASGIRDEAALISALMRPQIGYYDTLVQQAAGAHGELSE